MPIEAGDLDMLGLVATPIHLRSLQALSQLAIEKNETLIVPVPIDLLASILKLTTSR